MTILRFEGRYEEAERYLEGLREHTSGTLSGADVWTIAAVAHHSSTGRFEQALFVIDQTRETGQLTWLGDWNLRRAVLLQYIGAVREARAVLEECVASCPAETREWAHGGLARLMAAEGDLSGALQQIEHAAGVYVWATWHRAMAAQFHWAMGDRAQARETLEKVRLSRWYWVRTWGLYAVEQLRSVLDPDDDAAEERWERLLERASRRARGDPFNAEIGKEEALRALCLIRLGDRDGARRAIERASKIEPERADVAYYAAAAYALLGDTDRGLARLRKAIERGHQGLWWARVDPDLDGLRDDPEFDEILADWDRRLRAIYR